MSVINSVDATNSFMRAVVDDMVEESIVISKAALVNEYMSVFDYELKKDLKEPPDIFADRISCAAAFVQKNKSFAYFAGQFGIDFSMLKKKKVLPAAVMLMRSFDEVLPKEDREAGDVLLKSRKFLKALEKISTATFDLLNNINDRFAYKFKRLNPWCRTRAITQTLMMYDMWSVTKGDGPIADRIEEERENLFAFLKSYECPSEQPPFPFVVEQEEIYKIIESSDVLKDVFQKRNLFLSTKPLPTICKIANKLKEVFQDVARLEIEKMIPIILEQRRDFAKDERILPDMNILSRLEGPSLVRFAYHVMKSFPYGVLALFEVHRILKDGAVKRGVIPSFSALMWASILVREEDSLEKKLKEASIQDPVPSIDTIVDRLRGAKDFLPFCERTKISPDLSNDVLFQSIVVHILELLTPEKAVALSPLEVSLMMKNPDSFFKWIEMMEKEHL